MNCPSCGAPIAGKMLFCAKCGRRLVVETRRLPEPDPPQESARVPEVEPWPAPEGEDDAPPPPFGADEVGNDAQDAGGPPERGCLRSATVLVVAATVVMLIVGLGIAAVYYGMRDRTEAIQQAAELHYGRGLTHLAQQDLELAIAELELALQLNPTHERANAALDEARGSLVVRPSPTPVFRQEMNVAYYADLEAAYEAQEWARVVELSDRLWSIDPDYRRAQVEGMLFDAFIHSAEGFIAEARVEEAIRLYDRALQLQPGVAGVERARDLASLYMEAMTYWGADWGRVLEPLDALYETAPGYLDVADRLYDAAVAYGDLFAQQGDWCVAVTQYDRALETGYDAAVAARREESAAYCRVSPTDTPEGTPGPEGWPTPSGAFVGRVVEQTPLESDKIYIRGRVLDRNGRGVGGVVVKIQAWDWSVTHVSDGNGLFSFDGLNQPVAYTLSLENYPGASVEAPGEWGKITWVEFKERG